MIALPAGSVALWVSCSLCLRGCWRGEWWRGWSRRKSGLLALPPDSNLNPSLTLTPVCIMRKRPPRAREATSPAQTPPTLRLKSKLCSELSGGMYRLIYWKGSLWYVYFTEKDLPCSDEMFREISAIIVFIPPSCEKAGKLCWHVFLTDHKVQQLIWRSAEGRNPSCFSL